MKSFKFPQKVRQAGFTLIEIMFAVALVGIFAAVIITKISSADDTSKAQMIQDDVNQIIGAAKQWKGIKVSYAGITFAQLTGSHLLREDWANGAGINPVNGNYTIASNGQTVTVTATSLTDPLCQAILHKMEGSVGVVACAGGVLSVTQ